MRDPGRASALPDDAAKAAGSRIYVASFVGFLVFFVLVLVGIRLHLGIGWGDIEQANGRELVGVGLAHGVLDNFSYAAWAQQAKHGHFVFENLFTTEPHRPLMVNLLFWLVGVVADLLSASPLFVMVVLSLPAAALTIVCVWLVCRRIGLHQRAALLAAVFVAYGSGLSVPLLALLPHRPWYRGADSSFLDAIPATVFPFYPYHTISLALAAALLLTIVLAERSPAGRPGKAHLWLVFAAGAAAVWSHPYEPTALLVVYGVHVLSTLGSERRAELLRLRLPILLSLAAAVLPAALYYFWITTEPVWSAFAVETWQIPGTRLNWLVGLGLFWLAAALGAVISRGRGYRGIEILVLWTAFLFVILIILDGWRIKLASGGFFALAILSAIAVHEGVSWIATKTRQPVRALLMTGLLAAVASTCLSPIVLYTKPRSQTEYFEIDAELLTALSVIRAQPAAAIPAVLTDARTGRYLPALAPVRVYAGHWSLTVDVVDKVHRLIAAGFERESAERPLPTPERQAALAELLSAARFDYVLVAKDRPAAPLVRSQPKMRPTFVGTRWLLFANDARTD